MWTEVSLDFELTVLFGVLVALCIWFVVANPVRGRLEGRRRRCGLGGRRRLVLRKDHVRQEFGPADECEAGERIHSFSIELQQDEPAKTVTGPKKSKASPVKDDLEKVVRPVKKNARKAAVIVPTKAIQAAKPVAAPPPLPAAPPVKVPAPQPATSAVSPGLFSILPFGFFAPDPKDSAASGLSPDLRDDPRFTTLRGLGVKPTDLPDLPPDAP